MPAASMAITSAPGVAYDGRITWYVFWACLVAASGGLLFGYDIGVTGGVTSMDDFLIHFFPQVAQRQGRAATEESAWCKYNDQILQLFTSSLFLAGIAGGVLGSWTTITMGRVRTMFVAGLFFLLGAGLTGGASYLWMLVLGRLSLGLGVGLANQSVPLYLSEMAPAKWRGALNQMFQLATTIGILVAQVINYETQFVHPHGWRISLAMAGVPAALLALGGVFLPETPNSLMERGQREKGRSVLQKIRGVDVNIEPEYADIALACERARKVNPFTIFRRAYIPELTIAILIPLFQQLAGINAIMFYVAPLFKMLGFGDNASLFSALITGGVNVLATLVSIALVDRLGRKPLFVWGGVQMIIAQVVVAIVLAIFFKGNGALDTAVASVVVAMICIYVAGFAWSWGPLGWLVPSEIHPLETRSTGQSITVAVNFLFTFIIGQSFLSMICTMQWGIFLFFAGCIFIMTLVIIFLLPETKNTLIEDVPEKFKAIPLWRKYVLEREIALQNGDHHHASVQVVSVSV